MKKFADFVAKNSKWILIVSLLLLVPAFIGYKNTRINYDILVYLPDNIDTIKGEEILTEDFGLGAYAFVITSSKSSQSILKLEQKIKKIDGVNQVLSIADVIDTTIPMDMLPNKVLDKINKNGETIIIVTFNGSTSEDVTIEAVRNLREVVDDASRVSSMTSLVIDTMDLSNNEMVVYVVIAVFFCLFVLGGATDSYLIPILLLSNIGIAILYNLGTNIFLGEISYITKAITAILQLGVTTDFSIFLYHKYEQAKDEYGNKVDAMSSAIVQTFQSVIGSSLTTFAGFLALCTMSLTLGMDIGIVMAKGVLCGLVCVLTLFPSLLLVFDKALLKTKHKNIFPKFSIVQEFCVKHYKAILFIFILLLVSAYIGNSQYEVYYKLDDSLPKDLPFAVANTKLAEDFGLVSPQILLLDKNIKTDKVNALVDELKGIEGIDFVISPSTLLDKEMARMLPNEIRSMLENDKYQLLLLNSKYENASNELNAQIELIEEIVKKYDEDALVAGEGALMKDLVTIADHDFKAVNYTSLLVIFIIMVLVLKQISLPVILIFTIEFAIFANMAISYYAGVALPFIASIVVGTIQLGATIDYAILMSTKYLEIRKNEGDKFKAIQDTLKVTVASVITSALCFFAATFGVAIYTKINMIGSICELLARGSIISMVVVILILPSLLILFDKMIIKERRNNMKKGKLKTALFMSGVLLLAPFSASAKTKTQMIYTHADYQGNPTSVVVHNHLYTNGLKEFKDVSSLNHILNLNGDEEFRIDGENIIWSLQGKDIFYQGSTDEELPLSIKATYYLNDEEVNPKDILGKAGDIKVELKFFNNSLLRKNSLYTPIVVMTGMILDNNDAQEIMIDHGKVLDTGNKSYLLGMASPGLYESLGINELKNMGKVTIRYTTNAFSSSEIYIVASPKLLSDIDFAIFDKINTLNSSIHLLEENMQALENGADNLENGVRTLFDGSSELTSSIKTLRDAISAIDLGATSLDNGLLQIIGALDEASDSLLANSEMSVLLEQITTIKGANQQLIAKLSADEALKMQNAEVIAVLEMNVGAYTKIEDEFKKLLFTLNQTMDTLKKSLNTAEAGAKELSVSLTKVKVGVNKLYEGSVTLNNGIVVLKNGTVTLNEGIHALNTNGIKVLQKEITRYNNYSQKMKDLVNLSKDYNGFGTSNAEDTTFIYKIEM